MVEQDVAIVAVVVPALQVLLVLKVLLELKEDILAICKVVNKEARSVSKVDIGADES